MADLFGLKLGQGQRAAGLRMISAGLFASAIVAAASAAAAQPAIIDPAQREAVRAEFRSNLDRIYSEAERALQLGDCRVFAIRVRDLRVDGNVVRNFRGRAQRKGVFFSSADQLALDRYALDLIRKLPRDCPPPAASDEPPVEYVKVCEIGSGFYYIPGTQICERLPGGASPATSEGATFEFAARGNARSVTGNVQRLARDQGGTIYYDLGNEKQNGSGAGFNVGARIPINTQFFGFKSYINVAYNYLSVKGDGSGGQATTADFILFPGLGVGANPNGFAAGGGMPFGYRYDFTQQRHGGEIAAGFEIEQGPVEFYPWAGVRFGSNSVEDRYTVSRPLPVPINATYTTDSRGNSVGVFAGLSVSVQPERSPVEYFVQGRAGVDSNWVKSDVNFNIVFPGTDETQQTSVSQQKFTPYLFLETGFKVKLGVLQATVAGSVEHGGYAASVSIPGGGAPPVLKGETETNYGGRISLTARFK